MHCPSSCLDFHVHLLLHATNHAPFPCALFALEPRRSSPKLKIKVAPPPTLPLTLPLMRVVALVALAARKPPPAAAAAAALVTSRLVTSRGAQAQVCVTAPTASTAALKVKKSNIVLSFVYTLDCVCGVDIVGIDKTS